MSLSRTWALLIQRLTASDLGQRASINGELTRIGSTRGNTDLERGNHTANTEWSCASCRLGLIFPSFRCIRERAAQCQGAGGPSSTRPTRTQRAPDQLRNDQLHRRGGDSNPRYGVTRTPVFETGTFSRSDTSPKTVARERKRGRDRAVPNYAPDTAAAVSRRV